MLWRAAWANKCSLACRKRLFSSACAVKFAASLMFSCRSRSFCVWISSAQPGDAVRLDSTVAGVLALWCPCILPDAVRPLVKPGVVGGVDPDLGGRILPALGGEAALASSAAEKGLEGLCASVVTCENCSEELLGDHIVLPNAPTTGPR
eukprot:CAMPEP_0180827758 /NCGR_PEP_ID=MMETSP1038_2-20121128/74329_1 /TAXON_ID=632150 /ORGANISM="Azadinium spinosum, Strain 3D9" /LENGTH=148 /DNA_ID=CAMNT_0022870617 /DNA_START=424 /DNA_END=870 /DNA_ORIENTATION=-